MTLHLPHLNTKANDLDYKNDWGTPNYIIDIALHALAIDQFDLDLASNAEHNERIRAKQFCTNIDPTTWRHTTGSVWCNPPGPAKRVQQFWTLLQQSTIRRAAFLFFNVDHMRKMSLDDVEFDRWTMILLRKRVKYIGALSGASFPSALLLKGAVYSVHSDVGVRCKLIPTYLR